MEAGIVSLLEKYRFAFDSADPEAIADCYHEPSVTIRGDGTFHILRDHKETARILGEVARQYHEEGMQRGVYTNLDVKMIGMRCALATMDWQLLRTNGGIIRKWRQSYNIIEQNGACLFYVSTFHI